MLSLSKHPERSRGINEVSGREINTALPGLQRGGVGHASPNDEAHLPGPPVSPDTLESRDAAPVRRSVWLGRLHYEADRLEQCELPAPLLLGQAPAGKEI